MNPGKCSEPSRGEAVGEIIKPKMPLRLLALVTWLVGNAIILAIAAAEAAFGLSRAPIVGLALAGIGGGLALSAYGICQRIREVKLLLPVLLVCVAVAHLALGIVAAQTFGIEAAISGVRGVVPYAALLIVSWLVLRSRVSATYFGHSDNDPNVRKDPHIVGK